MNDVELAIRLTADANDAAAAMDEVGDAAIRMGNDVDAGTRDADAASNRLDGVADASDNVASKGAQAAGALSGLGDLMGGPFGAAMVVGGTAMQAAADAGDLLNVVTESNIVRKAKDIVVTTTQKTVQLATAAATRVMTAAQWALNAAMRANPIGLAITAAIALAALFVLLYKRSDRFRAIVQSVMAASKRAIDIVWKALQVVGKVVAVYLVTQWKVYKAVVLGVWKAIQVAIRIVFAAIKLYLTAYKTVALAVWSAVREAAVRAWGFIRDYVSDRVKAVRDLARTISDKFATAWTSVKDKGRAAFDALTAPVQRIIDMVESVLDKISKIKLPDLNPLNGRVAVPGSVNSTGVPAVVSSSTGTPVTININVTAGVGDPIAIAAQISQVLSRRATYLGSV